MAEQQPQEQQQQQQWEPDFEKGDSGSSKTYPKQCSALRKNDFVLIKGHPCKIAEMSTSKTGKHGHAKVHLVGLDIFTSKKYEDVCPSTHNMDVPVVIRKDYQLLDCDEEGYLCLMDDRSELREDIKADKEVADEIKGKKDKETLTVTVMSACNEERVVGWKCTQ